MHWPRIQPILKPVEQVVKWQSDTFENISTCAYIKKNVYISMEIYGFKHVYFFSKYDPLTNANATV